MSTPPGGASELVWQHAMMRSVMYVLVFLCGLCGLGGALRFLERAIFQQDVAIVLLLKSMVFLYLASAALKRARGAQAESDPEDSS